MSSTALPVPSPLKDFKRLGSATYIYEPPTTVPTKTTLTSSTPPPPDFILLPSWLDAAPKHIAKYTNGYHTLYPHARILVITTSLLDVTIRSKSYEAQRIRPALDVLLALPANTLLLVHLFSNGGAVSTTALARAYLATTGRPLPIHAQVLDSSPGHGYYARTVAALRMSLPKKPLIWHYITLLCLHIFLVAYYTTKTLLRERNLIVIVREALNDDTLFDTRCPRMYIYSKSDGMVHWRDVVEHAEEAERKGWALVRREEFVGSAHCGHLMVDEGRYWGCVRETWDMGDEEKR